MMMMAFSVFDTKVGSYQPPLFFPSRGSAIRWFEDACNDQQNYPFGRHRGDYRLFGVGGFDADRGVLLVLDKPDIVIGADEFGSRPAQGEL